MPPILAACIVAQSKHETGNYSSSIFLDCNNAFGYKAVRSSCQLHPGYQNYQTVSDSVHEITAWIKRRLSEGNFPALNTITSPLQYATLLKENGYYEDSLGNYANGISFYFHQLSTTGSGLFLAGLFLFLLIRKKRK